MIVFYDVVTIHLLHQKLKLDFKMIVYRSYDNKLSMFLLIQEIKQKVSLREV